METLEILIAARALIEKPENWAQGIFAADSEGNELPAWSLNANCFCAIGAIARAGKMTNGTACYHPATDALASVLGKKATSAVAEFNDTRSHSDVLDLFDRAIAAASAHREYVGSAQS